MADYEAVPARFGELLAAGDFVSAHGLLTKGSRGTLSPLGLQQKVESMISYSPGPIRTVQVVPEGLLLDWPAKETGDVAHVYVSLEGDGFVEAVTVIVAREEGKLKIRDIEWGRP